MRLDVAFPYQLDGQGRTATATPDDHIRQMLEQLLFTRPGERVNRPDFGCGLLDLLFGPNSPELAAALRVTTSAAIQQWLGDVIQLRSIEVDTDDSALRVAIAYTAIGSEAPATATFRVPAGR